MMPVSLECPFLIAPSVFSNIYLSFVYSMKPVSLDYPFLIAPSVFSSVYLSCVLYDTSFSGMSVYDCTFGIL
jgi:hypothetical protein